MASATPKEVFVTLLSDLRHNEEQSPKIYAEFTQAAHTPEIMEALGAREFVSNQIPNRLDECFRLMGEKPAKVHGELQDAFLGDFRRELNEIKSPVGRRLFVLANANKLVHLLIGEYGALIAASDVAGHPGVGVLLESCLSDKLAFIERIRRQINQQLREELVSA